MSFYELTPERVLDAVEGAGLRCTGRSFALNSFENRVYEVDLEPEDDVDFARLNPTQRLKYQRVVKFYRPGRWSREQILEEHEWIRELNEFEVPAIGPIEFSGSTLHRDPGSETYFALFPKVGGRAPDELSLEHLHQLGRLLGRLHRVGATHPFRHRLTLSPETYGRAPLRFLLAGDFLSDAARPAFQEVVEETCDRLEDLWNGFTPQRLHADCHLGNFLWFDGRPHFLDFDDAVMGPPVQDLWLAVGERWSAAPERWESLIEGYEEWQPLDRSQLKLVEGLRSLRQIHYSAWIARRWDDPAFPPAFPHFGSPTYWQNLTRDLEDQLSWF